MEEPTNDETNPMKSTAEEPFSVEQPTAQEEVGQTRQSTIEGKPETNPEKNETPKKKNITPEMEEELKRLLRGTNRGRGLMVHLDSLARPDLFKNAVNVNWVKDIQALDVSVQPFDLNPGIFERFRGYCWNNAMTFRFDDSSGKLIIIVRWFLPDVLPIMDPNLNALAMMTPETSAPPEGIIPRNVPPAKPDLKEVK